MSKSDEAIISLKKLYPRSKLVETHYWNKEQGNDQRFVI